jgi:hypothetical protein
VVVAGLKTAVQRAIEAAKARGAKRAVLLPVSVPSHSSLMRGAADKLSARLSQTPLRMPDVPAVYTVGVRTHESQEGIRRALKEQLFSPVRWADTVRAMIAKGATTLIECGPGKVLTTLNRRVERRPDLTMLAVDDPATLEAAPAACREKEMSEKTTAVVTGASRGIGRAIALELGGAVRGSWAPPPPAGGAAAIGEYLLRPASPAAAPGSTSRSRIRWRPSSRSSTPPKAPSTLVNNAGVTRDGLPDADERRGTGAVLETDLSSVYRTCKAVMRGMMKARYGRIVNIASVIAVMGNAGQSNYAAAKAG